MFLAVIIITLSIAYPAKDSANDREILPQQVTLAPKTKLEIEKFIKLAAEKHGIDSDKFLKVAFCESSLNPNAIGDGGYSYGLWQIHSPSHPTVDKETALDVVKSTEWAAEKFKVNPNIWTCYRKLFSKK